jgi:hypothetical protein
MFLLFAASLQFVAKFKKFVIVPVPERSVKWKAKELENANGKPARRDAHDAKDKGSPDRTKKQINEDYEINK